MLAKGRLHRSLDVFASAAESIGQPASGVIQYRSLVSDGVALDRSHLTSPYGVDSYPNTNYDASIIGYGPHIVGYGKCRLI